MDHILGKIKPEERTAGRPVTAPFDEDSKGRPNTNLSHNALEDNEDKPKTSGRKSNANTNKSKSAATSNNPESQGSDYKYDLPKNCKLEI